MIHGKVIIAGGSGFLGISLARHLTAAGYEVFILSRSSLPPDTPARHLPWDGKTPGGWARELDGAVALVNLTGKNVNCRYTEKALAEINSSRVDSVKVLGEAIRSCRFPPPVWVQAGSLAIYGDSGDRICDESTPHGEGIPVDTCLRWEKAFHEEAVPHTRKVMYRISFVLGREGGALTMLTGLTRFFLGGAIGSGRQYISWLHVEDMNRLWQRAIEDERMSGTYNATGPDPVTNAEFMTQLRHVMHRPWSPPLPAFLVPIGCVFLRTEPVLALTGRRGLPVRLEQEGFEFLHPKLRDALHEILETPKT